MLLAPVVFALLTTRIAAAPVTSSPPERRTTFASPLTLTGDTTGIHDPSIVKSSDGTYLVYGSGGWANAAQTQMGFGIPTWSSPDQKAWTFLGDAFATPPGDTDRFIGATNASLWAPHVTYSTGIFWMYYSASQAGSQNSGIFLVFTGLPGTWSDQGLIVSSNEEDGWNAIDPYLVIDGSDWYLAAGSYWSGIKLLALDSSSGKLNGSVVTSLARRTAGGNAIEGASLYFNAPYWYLFTSWDNCCQGTSPNYNVRVVRSKSITGPYVDQDGVDAMNGGGSEVLGSHGNIAGPGGQSIMIDSDGIVLVYHYLENSLSVPHLGINFVAFSESEWPEIV